MALALIHELFDGIVDVLSLSARLNTIPYEVDVIVNPVAGKVARRHILHHEIEVIHEFIANLKEHHHEPLNARLHISEHRGNTARIAREIIEGMRSAARSLDGLCRRLVVSVGGDGTHEEVLSELFLAEPDILDNLEIFRLPMGTGNDAADAAEVHEACELLYRGEHGRKIGAVRVQAAGLPPLFSFNIASLGIDAYVTDMTNRLKPVLPGNAYKIIADVATLFYEPKYRRRLMTVTAELSDGTVESFSGRFLLIAMGLTGKRVYGGALPVLPGDENLCMMTKVGVVRKIFLKKMLYQGAHVFQPETTMRQVQKITIDYDGKIPVQVDGESRWLTREHFPVEIEVLDPRIHLLSHPVPTESHRSSPAERIQQSPSP